MAIVQSMRGMRLMQALVFGTVNGAQLEALLADSGRRAEWVGLLARGTHVRRMTASSTAMAAVAASSTAMAAVIASSTAMAAVIASSTAMAAVAASSTAMAAVAASSTAMAAVIASSTAMAAVIASSTAMAAVAASSTAMAAVIASPTAMAAVAASPTAITALHASDVALTAIADSSAAASALRGAANYSVVSWVANGTTPRPISLPGSKYILLGVSSTANTANRKVSVTTLRPGSSISNETEGVTAASSGTSGAATRCAIPLVGPYSGALNGSGSATVYFGLLRCD